MNNKIIWTFDDILIEQKIIGPLNQNLELISKELGVEISHTYNQLSILYETKKEDLIVTLLTILTSLEKDNIKWGTKDLYHIIFELTKNEDISKTKDMIINFYHNKPLILNTYDGSRIYAKTLIQKLYIEELEKNSILFATGPAGTGKTYLAVAYAVNKLKKNEIKKIIITRPAVEAGEKLGFLPGDLKEKVDPYLIPIYDALNDFLGKETVEKLVEKGVIEIAPLAYMRGRTLDHAIVILDEAQNTTSNQMKMFITRLGFDSKMIITGDMSQVDLQKNETSGLFEATHLLKNIKGIDQIKFGKYDVMRHPLVSKIIERYEEAKK